MKLVRYGAPGREKPGILDGQGRIRDLSGVVPDIAGEILSPRGLAKIRKAKIDKLPLVRGGAPWNAERHQARGLTKRKLDGCGVPPFEQAGIVTDEGGVVNYNFGGI